MPEGPEVRLVTEWLHATFKNSIITKIMCDKVKQGKAKPNLPLLINGVTCKGKHIIFICSDVNKKNIYIHNHLGMTGKWLLTKGDHSDISLFITNPNQKNPNLPNQTQLHFDDSRKFGNFSIHSLTELTLKLKNVGYDLMDCAIKYNRGDVKQLKTLQMKWRTHFTKLKSNTRSQKRTIYSVLMDQKRFAGIGNYLAAEILYNCKISPKRIVSALSPDEIVNLFNTSIVKLFYFYSNTQTKKIVYGQDKDPNGYEIIKTKLPKRTCHWVPELQK